MGFDIPMNTTGCMGVGDLLSLNGGSRPNSGVGASAGMTQPQMNQPQYTAQPQPTMSQPQPTTVQPQPTMAQSTTAQSAQPRQRQFGSGVVLKKGQKVNLAGNTGLTLNNIRVGLGWDIVNQACDLDASAFMLGDNGKVIGDDWFVFYGQTVSPDNSIRHSGDSNGAGAGDDEIIDINLSAVNPSVKKIVFVVTINEALERGLNFSMVSNAYVRVTDSASGQELVRFSLTDYYANVTSMMVGEIYNHNGVWKFNAIGNGVAKDLAGLCEMYGVNVVG